MSPLTDDSLMNRFDEHGLRRFRARDAIIAVTLASLLLVLFEGAAVRRAGEQMDPGLGRDIVLAVGKPAGAIADALPLASAADSATGWLSPDGKLDARDSFTAASAVTGGDAGVPPVTADAFDPARLGAPPPPKRRLRTLLVTGDSMATPLDSEVSRLLVDDDVRVIGEPHLGTGISKSFLVDWGQLSARQVKRDHPNAVVVFIGANEGFPMKGPGGREVECCGADWAAVYANRVRRMVDTYRQKGAARIYWIGIPAPRSKARAEDQPRRQRGRRGRDPAVARAGPGRRHRRDLHPERLPRRDEGRRRREHRPPARRHPPQPEGRGAARRHVAETDPPGLCVLARTSG